MGDVVLSHCLRVRGNDGGDSWPEMLTQLIVTENGRFVVMSSGDSEVDRIMLEVTSSVFETTLGANTFEIVTTSKILHLSTPSVDLTTTWIKYLRDSISKCDPFPKDSIFKEALTRQPGDFYDVKFLDHKPLGIVLERSGEWALAKVAKSDAGVQVGSALSSIDDNSILLSSYSQVIERLKNWTPPLKLTFRRAPVRQGFLMKQSVHKKNRSVAKIVWKKRYFTLKEGILVFSDSDSPTAKVMGEVPLMGGSINLVPFDVAGRNCCFKVLSGVSSLVVQADTVNEMFDWACALYYGMAIANGGGYLLAMELSRISGNKTREESEAEAIAKTIALEDEKLMKEKARREEKQRLDQVEVEEEDRRRQMKEDERKVAEAADVENAKNRLSMMLDKKAAMDDVMRSGLTAVDEGSSAGVEQALDSAIHIDRGLAEMVLASKIVEETRGTVAEEEPLPELEEPEPLAFSERDRVAEASEAPEDGEEIEPEETFAVDIEQRDSSQDADALAKVFNAYAKHSDEDDGVGYINVMQFSTIWRLATGVKGNLFKEMKIFNTFDTGGKGMLHESDFVEGWLKLGEGAGGDALIRNLKSLVKGENLLL